LETVDKEVKLLKDTSALMQTMQLEKFAFVNNKYIKRQRKKCRKWLYQKFKAQRNNSTIKVHKDNKWKYIQRLVLFNARLSNRNDIEFDKSTNTVKNASLFKCNTKWPICLYDHSLKSRCPSYFAFHCGGLIEFIDSYFDSTALCHNQIPLNPIAKKSETEQYDALLIERNLHYCTNKEFVAKMNKLLEHKQTEWAFDNSLSNINSETTLLNVMDNYTNFITEIDEDVIEGFDDENFHGSILQSSEPYSSLDSFSERGKKGLQLGMYITSITPNRNDNKH